jgi:NLI interacting factor-like phosphatase
VLLDLESDDIGLKRVTIRPHCRFVLKELSLIANLVVWTSMKREHALLVTEFLFKDQEPPLYVLGQEQCNILKCRNKRGKISNYRVRRMDKDLFLKPLDKLFQLENSVFSLNNTIIVDDSLAKHITNFLRNVILFETWSYQGDRASDGILIDHLLPWIQRLHLAKPQSLYSYRLDNLIGRWTLGEEPNSSEYMELVGAINESNSLYNEYQESCAQINLTFEESNRSQYGKLQVPIESTLADIVRA